MSDFNRLDEDFQTDEKPKKQKLGDSGKPMIHTESLKAIFSFSETTLSTNRNGFPTGGQKQVLQDELKNDADAMWLLLTILLGTSLLLAFIFRMQGIPMQYLVYGAGIMLLPMLWVGYRQQTKVRLDVDNLKVRSVQGQSSVYWTGRGTHLRPRLKVAERWFEIDVHEAHALEEYDLPPLRAYYAENTNQLLSVEVMPMDSYHKLKVEDLQDEEAADLIIESGRRYDEREA